MLIERKNRSFVIPYFDKSILDVVSLFLENGTVEVSEEEEIYIDQTNEEITDNNNSRKDGLNHLARLCRSESIPFDLEDNKKNC